MPVVDTGLPAAEPACSSWVAEEQLPCAVSGIASPDQIALAIETSSQILWALSGRRFGTCPISVRPCRRRCRTEPYPTLGNTWTDYGIAPNLGDWFAWFARCGSCADRVEDCGCSTLEEIELPRPVASVSEVIVDGVVLPTTAYRVDSHRRLVRLDGGLFPTCQNMALDLSQPGTFGVSLYRGSAVPAAGTMAAGELACELVRAVSGEKCRLPSRVTSLTRSGVTIAALDPMTFLEKGLTGLYRVDLFLAAYNPAKLRRRGSVASPDTLRRRARKVDT